jgi:hypothetical protein
MITLMFKLPILILLDLLTPTMLAALLQIVYYVASTISGPTTAMVARAENSVLN